MTAMKTRILYGSLMLAAMVGLLWLDYHLEDVGFSLVGLPVGALFGLLAVLGTWEVGRLTSAAGLPMLRKTAAIGVLAVATAPVWRQLLPAVYVPLVCPPDADLPANPLQRCSGSSWLDAALLAAALAVAMAFFVQMARHRTADAIKRLAATLLTIGYLGLLGGIVLALRVRFGLPALAVFLAAVKFTDIGAYFVGSAVGRHKLIPWLSPGKSWEGLFGGLAAAAGMSMLTSQVLPAATGGPLMGLWQAAVFGAAVGLAGQFGDLCESLLKRDAGLKDSGSLVPNFGGMLDIVDSPLMAAPAGYVLLLILSNSG